MNITKMFIVEHLQDALQHRGVSIAGSSGRLWEFPGWADLLEVISLQQYNTRLIVLSATILGMAAGLMGCFLLLRKRSLMADALSHACLPGIALLFLLITAFGGMGKNLPLLLFGAATTGIAGVAMVLLIRRYTRIRDDAAMGIVLSVFFGFGVVLLGMIQTMPGASAAGLETFIYGKTASMVRLDFILLSFVSAAVVALTLLLHKEFTLICFDETFAATRGWPVLRLDLLMLILVATVTVAGLQAVGLILIIAFLIIPAASARFWTHQLHPMLWIAAATGAASGWVGASLSALLPRLPAGAIIVLVSATLFLLSMAFGRARGVIPIWIRRQKLNRKVGRQHLLRAIIEILEDSREKSRNVISNHPVDLRQLRQHRSWSDARLRTLIRQARQEDHIEHADGNTIRLSESGFGEAARTTRNHRLWEQFLIEHAAIAPGHVDRDADAIEHVLSAELVHKLEAKLAERDGSQFPDSPHPLTPEKGKTS